MGNVEACRKWREANRESARASCRRWVARNPDKHRNYYMLWKFGITIEQKRAMIVGQGGRCAACGQDILRLPTREQHLDHDHRKKKGDPGFIRGVVCKGCNTAIGFAKEDPDRLVRIAHYLRRHSDF